MVGPAVNFMSSLPTLIEHNDHDYIFEGFSIFSHQSLSEVSLCGRTFISDQIQAGLGPMVYFFTVRIIWWQWWY